MPKAYERIRDEHIMRGYSERDAKTKAARIYNSQRKSGEKPVTTSYGEKKKK